jgi:hypothetical protein
MSARGPEAAQDDARLHVRNWEITGLVMLIVSLAESDPKLT